MPDHPSLHRDLAGFVLDQLDPSETDAFQSHIRGCERCRVEVQELRGLPLLIEQVVPSRDVPDELEGRVLRAIAAQPLIASKAPRRRRLTRALVATAAVAAVATGTVGTLTIAQQSRSSHRSTVVLETPAARNHRGGGSGSGGFGISTLWGSVSLG